MWVKLFKFRKFKAQGYFPWIHGKFICKGEGKWSCPGLRSYRSYGVEVMGDSLTSKLDGYLHNFNPTPTGEKPVRDENCLGIKLH